MTLSKAKLVERDLSMPADSGPLRSRKLFLREFTRELAREISPATKILTLAGVVLSAHAPTHCLPSLYLPHIQRG